VFYSKKSQSRTSAQPSFGFRVFKEDLLSSAGDEEEKENLPFKGDLLVDEGG